MAFQDGEKLLSFQGDVEHPFVMSTYSGVVLSTKAFQLLM